MAGTVATWQHDIQFQPPDGTPDKGRLEQIPPDRMQERGLDGSYIESWRWLTDGRGRFLVIRVQHSGRLLRTLVVVGYSLPPYDQLVRNLLRDSVQPGTAVHVFDPDATAADRFEELLATTTVSRQPGLPAAVDRLARVMDTVG